MLVWEVSEMINLVSDCYRLISLLLVSVKLSCHDKIMLEEC